MKNNDGRVRMTGQSIINGRWVRIYCGYYNYYSSGMAHVQLFKYRIILYIYSDLGSFVSHEKWI